MHPPPQQIALDLNRETTPDPALHLEPETRQALITLMAEAIIAIVEPTGRWDDDEE